MVAAVAPADAVSGQALACQEALARAGIEGEIYAEHVHPELADRVRPLDALRGDYGGGDYGGGGGDGGDGDAVVLHYSIWSAAAERAGAVARERLGLIYHNVTPSHLLAEANPGLAALCDRGRRELPALAARARVVLAVSAYNARELAAAGAPTPQVVPPLLDLPRPPPPRPTVPPSVLYVGRVVPSKRVEDAVRALAVLRRHLLPGARLEVVGSWEGFETYKRALERLAERLGVASSVRFHGRVSDADRDTAYAEAGAYLSMSEHEGFCVPLLEALAHGVPVVARAVGAVPETLGGAGLVLPRRDPALAAEALLAVLTDAALRRELARRASSRLRALAPRAVEPRLLSALTPLLR